MNKENIYQIIGYQGEYNNNVKKAIRKLLKDNHPDNHGDSKTFQIINEVKQELENNTVSYKVRNKSDDINNKKYDDFDYDFCKRMINKLTKDFSILNKSLKKKEELLKNIQESYNYLYRECLEKEKYLLSRKDDLEKNQKMKKRCLFFLIILIALFIVSILHNNIYLLLIFAIGCLLLLYQMYDFMKNLKKINIYNQKEVHEYIKLMRKVDNLCKEKNQISLEIVNLKRKIKKKENDLRFYHNIIN